VNRTPILRPSRQSNKPKHLSATLSSADKWVWLLSFSRTDLNYATEWLLGTEANFCVTFTERVASYVTAANGIKKCISKGETVFASSTAQLVTFVITELTVSVGIATMLRAGRPRAWGSIHGRGNRCFFSPQNPDRLWGPPSFLHNGQRERGKTAGA
jgi:hypothetical protein